ncbi:MAG: chorismate mutase [Coriobacteriia bacterium]|nr:chorismate mutase [Coriobacteriia bacterium]MCL2536824.1 chorismate mutase [Coriobacteriia bacterium]
MNEETKTDVNPCKISEKYSTDMFESVEKAQFRLAEIRQGIDSVDEKILDAFLQRMVYVDRVAEIKKSGDISIHQAEREKCILARVTEGLDADLAADVTKLFNCLFEISRNKQG